MYLYTSVKNNSVRKLSQSKKNAVFSIDELSVEFASPDQNAEGRLLTQELSSQINSAVDQLPERCKVIFKLAKEDKLKYKEIASLLQVSIKTIDNQIATAVKKISSALNIPAKKTTSP
jgi:RNA polymerase sigma-70 factor (ECF subfamily)